MELLQLRYFCDAAETENFSLTARRYMIPPSAVSQTVKRLERELNAPLFDRIANRIRLNENGKILYKKAKEALTLLDESAREIADHAEELTGELRLLVCSNRQLLSRVIEEFREQYPRVSLLLDHTPIGSYDRYDLVISPDPLPSDQWEMRPLVTEDFLLAVSDKNPLAVKETVTVSDLAGENFVSMTDESNLSHALRAICLEHGFAPNITIQCDDPHYVRQYVALNLGVSLIPSVSWEGQFPDGVTLKSIGPYQRNTYVYQRKANYHSRAAREFLRRLEQRKRI